MKKDKLKNELVEKKETALPSCSTCKSNFVYILKSGDVVCRRCGRREQRK